MASDHLDSGLTEAFGYAYQLHREQLRKQSSGFSGRGVPYISHLMGVASIVLEYGGDQEEAIAALLHDGPEDQGGRKTLEVIRQKFGDRVAAVVEACSDTLDSPKPEWQPRKELYLEHLRQSPSKSVLLVSMADKLHNVRSIVAAYRVSGDEVWQRFTGGKEGTLWYYDSLLEIFKHEGAEQFPALFEELERTLGELHVLVKQADL